MNALNRNFFAVLVLCLAGLTLAACGHTVPG